MFNVQEVRLYNILTSVITSGKLNYNQLLLLLFNFRLKFLISPHFFGILEKAWLCVHLPFKWDVKIKLSA